MNEEEIIKYIENDIEIDTDTASWFEENNETRKQIEKGIEAYKGLLDLYNQEKEKNKELIDTIAIYKSTLSDYIHKDKIKEKIEDLKNEYRQLEETSDFIIADVIQPKIQVLQELLEEE